MTSVRIQSVLYCPQERNLAHYLRAVGQMATATRRAQPALQLDLALADNSPSCTFDASMVNQVNTQMTDHEMRSLYYQHFPKNFGHGGGHNRLFAAGSDADYLLILNPDTSPAPTLILELLAGISGSVAIAEARQLPLEHQKGYDLESGDTSWASGACSLIRGEVFTAIGGFDEAFFLYCDDVDLSWRARLAGHRVVYQPTAVCFHDKRLSGKAKEVPSDTEIFHSGLAVLLLATKYSRPDIVERQLFDFRNSPLPIHAEIVKAFSLRHSEDQLPEPLDPLGTVADFSTYAFAPLRFDYDR